MSDFANWRQLKAANKIANSYYIADAASHDFATAAYCVRGLTAWKITAMTNTLMVNDSQVTSADTFSAGTEIGGKITAIKLNSGRAIAYCGSSAVFVS